MMAVPVLVEQTQALTITMRIARSFHDVIGIQLAHFLSVGQFCAAAQHNVLADTDVRELMGTLGEYGSAEAATLNEMSARVGQATGFSRNLFGLLPRPIRQLPRYFRSLVSRIDSISAHDIAFVIQQVGPVVTGCRILESFSMPNDAALRIIHGSIASTVAAHPGIVSALPTAVRALIRSATPIESQFNLAHPIVREWSGERRPILCNIHVAHADCDFDVLQSLVYAVSDCNVNSVRKAQWSVKNKISFYTSRERRPLPDSGFSAFDSTYNRSSLLRDTERATVLHESQQIAVVDLETRPNTRYFIMFPLAMEWFTSCSTRDNLQAYTEAPLSFARAHRGETKTTIGLAVARDTLDALNQFRKQMALAVAENYVVTVSKGTLDRGLAAVPGALATSVAYLIVARQLNISEAQTLAALEGLVHLLLGTFRARKAG